MEKLIERFKEDITDTRELDTISAHLRYLPRDILEKLTPLYDTVMDKCTERKFGNFMGTAASLGYLHFKPFIINVGPTEVMLVLKYNRFVRFRNGEFVVLYQPNGKSVYMQSSLNISPITNLLSGALRQSRMLKVMYYMNLLQACAGIDAFDEALVSDAEVIDAFMYATMKPIFGNYTLTYRELISCCTSQPKSTAVPIGIYRVAQSKTMDYVRFYVNSDRTISVEVPKPYNEPEWHTFKLPSIIQDVNVEEAAKEQNMSCEEITRIMDEAHDLNDPFITLVIYALQQCGFTANNLMIYNNEKRPPIMRALNRCDVVTINNIKELQ